MVHEGRASGGAGSRGRVFRAEVFVLKLLLFLTHTAFPVTLAAVCTVKFSCN